MGPRHRRRQNLGKRQRVMGPREEHWRRVCEDRLWDVVVVGGGATGLGIALHLAAQGLKTLLVERDDYAKGTSSRSTKLIHGGVRYLQQGNVRMVKESLRERGLLMKNAPHLVHDLAFVIPTYSWWRRWYYWLGLKVYDRLAGRLGLGKSRLLSVAETLAALPNVQAAGLTGGVLYHDGQFDDAQLAVALARTAAEAGATLVNHCSVVGWAHTSGQTTAAHLHNHLSGERQTVRARQFINATGPFVDALMAKDQPGHHRPLIRPSQGVHVVVDGHFLPGNTAMLIPRTDDGRVLFAVPWHGMAVLGTTDTEVPHATPEPTPLPAEIDFILTHTGRYLTRKPQEDDVRSVFAGIRPLAKAPSGTTADLSRDHTIVISPSGLLTIAGGKWTTYRKMAADVAKVVRKKLGDPPNRIDTKMLRLRGLNEPPFPAQASKLNPTELQAAVQFAAAQTQCMTVEDFLARRCRDLFLDVQAAIAIAPSVARELAAAHHQDEAWIARELAAFRTLTAQYLPPSILNPG